MAPPRTDARYDRGRIEAVPHGARRRAGLPHAHVPPRARGRPARPTSGAAADQWPQHRARPCHGIESPADSRKDLPQISLTMLATRRYNSRPL